MDWLPVVVLVLQIVVVFIFSLFVKNYLPSYFTEKGKNLATKEDIQDITHKIESTKLEYNRELESFKVELNKDLEGYKDTKKFLREYSYSQFKQLYVKLYAVIVQSEYVRYFFQIKEDFYDIPFLELNKKRTTQKINLSSTGMDMKSEEIDINDAITEFNKIKIANAIIENSEYASQEFLKLAVAYRFVHDNYTSNGMDGELQSKFQEEELQLISKIIKSIVSECNKLRKICEIDYNSNELESGILQWSDNE